MPKTSEMRESKYLKKEDVGRGMLCTVAGVKQMNVAQEGEHQELKWCMTFQETDKPLVLNATNIQMCEQVFASDDTEWWINKKIVLYTDPNVSYQGKLIGGIRVRAPKPTAVAAPPPPPPVPVAVVAAQATGDIYDDDIPF